MQTHRDTYTQTTHTVNADTYRYIHTDYMHSQCRHTETHTHRLHVQSMQPWNIQNQHRPHTHTHTHSLLLTLRLPSRPFPACLSVFAWQLSVPFTKIFYQSGVASGISFAAICWGSSIRASDPKELNKLIKKAGSVLGCQCVQMLYWHKMGSWRSNILI